MTIVPTLWVIMGSPRTGKSTVARALSEKIACEIVSVSDIRITQTQNTPQFTSEEQEYAYSTSVQRVVEKIKEGKPVIWEATFRSPEARKKIDEVKRLLVGTQYVFNPILLTANADHVEKRVQDTYAYHPDKDVTPDRAKELVTTYPVYPGAKVFFTDIQTVEEIVQNVLIS